MTAIMSVLNAELGEEVGTTAETEEMLLTLGAILNSRQNQNGRMTFRAKWLSEVDAANLLKEVFDRASSSRLEFAKTRHSFLLLKEIMSSSPGSITGLTEFVHRLVELSQDKA